MVVTIAYRDKPDDPLYIFSKAGDNVCIGRDWRQCGIALGINAQGVSRVHLRLELLSNGCVCVQDTSTYGTGYDGGPLVLEKKRELKPSAIIQVGNFFFIIKEKSTENEQIEKHISFPQLKNEKDRKFVPGTENSVRNKFERNSVEKSNISSISVRDELQNIVPPTARKDSSSDSNVCDMVEDSCSSDSDASIFTGNYGLLEESDLFKYMSENQFDSDAKVDNTGVQKPSRLLSNSVLNTIHERRILQANLANHVNDESDFQMSMQNEQAVFIPSFSQSSTKKRKDDLRNDDQLMIDCKRVKMQIDEVVDDICNPHEKEALMEKSLSQETINEECDLTLGMDVETLRMKLEKVVQYRNLEKRNPERDNSSFTTSINNMNGPNYKIFKKAAQGIHMESKYSRTIAKQIVGMVDLVDFRQLNVFI